MAQAPKPHPPFAWLGRFWVPVGLACVVGVAAFFRFYLLDSLPPGLDETSARIGLNALATGPSHWFPSLSSTNGYAPLWVWLQAISVHIFGHTSLALRLWPATLGTLAVFVSWFWMRDWFGKRIAWIVSFLLAVSPWAVQVSRSGVEAALPPLLIPLTLWVCSLAARKASPLVYGSLGAVLALDLLSGPIGWLFTATVLAIGIWKLAGKHELMRFTRERLIAGAILALGAATLAYLIGTSLSSIKTMSQTLNLVPNIGAAGHNLVKVLLMFNVHGDENYRHNLAGEPMLNAFVGIMIVTGLLVSISRLHKRPYRVVLILAPILLLPAVLTATGTPNSSWAIGTLPLVFALAGIGTGYMLELWYTTFPINSAARTTGQAAIILLLALSSLQGYTQYFRAWAGSTAVYQAYNEAAVQIAGHIKSDKFNGERYVVLPQEQIPVVNYLDYQTPSFRALTSSQLAGLPIPAANRQFYIAAASRDDSVKILKAKFPGGVLHPHYSPFNQAETYYTYEVNK